MKDKIEKLKNEQNAIILAHNYENIPIQKAADFVGDSLELSRKAAKTEKDKIIFCGVNFMAETAAILSPEKTVLIPERTALCTMAQMIEKKDIMDSKKQYPEASVVCYVNSSFEVKAASDVICTSSNAVEIVKKLESETIIFVPDRNLASYVAKEVPEKKIIIPRGFCYVHHEISVDDLEKVKESFLDAEVISHPECPLETLEASDYVASTSGIIKIIGESYKKNFIVCTEEGLLERIRLMYPSKNIITPYIPRLCYGMKKTNLLSLYNCLLKEQYIIKIDKKLIEPASKALARMFELTS